MRIVFGAVGLVIVILLTYGIFPRFFPALFSAIGLPMWKTENSIATNGSGVWGYFASKRSLLEENTQLKEQNALLSNQLLGYTTLLEENTQLKEALGRAPEGKAILAAVLKRPPLTAYDTMIVDVGEKDGVTLGDKVVIGGNNVIGDVAEVESLTSKVRLYSSNGIHTDVELGSTTIPTVAVGRGGGNFEATVPRDASVHQGDLITLPGARLQILGIVEDKTIDPARAFQTILFRTPFNMSEIKWLEIIKE